VSRQLPFTPINQQPRSAPIKGCNWKLAALPSAEARQ
jgi:hypothetical protein